MQLKLGIDNKANAYNFFKKNLHDSISMSVNNLSNMSLFTFKSELPEKEFFDLLADLILELILQEYVLGNLSDYILNYMREINAESRDMLYSISQNNILDSSMFLEEKYRIKQAILDYMEEHPIIYLEGFVLFRLKNLSGFLENVIDKSIGELDFKKEYNEFLSVLRYVANQESYYENIKLQFKGKEYILIDEDGNQIDLNRFKNIAKELGHKEVSQSDLVVSALLVLSPKRLSIQMFDIKNQEVMETIKILEEIFENRIYYCYGCNNCLRKVGNSKFKL